MSLAKVTRKLKRKGKTAVQFRITSTFEFIEIECKGSWRPENLRVVWYRNHRKVKSNDTTWVVSDDFGPNGARGRAVFNPAISVSLVVTLYRESNQTDFDEKEYKYHVENDGPGGKKILATFNCNIAEFVGIPSTKQALDLNLKCVSKKVKVVSVGITLESQFMKEGGALDDDMQSTFSAMSAGEDRLAYDDEEEEDEEEEELATAASVNRLSKVTEENEEASRVKEGGSENSVTQPPLSSISSRDSSQESLEPGSSRKSLETYVASPVMDDVEEEEEEEEATPSKPSPTEVWLDRDIVLVDCFNEVVDRERLDQADLIGLYFSAGWCPPCRRFLPKLVKFYHHLKQHGKSLEILYISSDYTLQEMMKYMKEQQMPWVAVSYEGSSSDELRNKFNVSAVPLFKIITRTGEMVEESAKKSVEGVSHGSSILKLYNKWHEGLVGEEGTDEDRVATISSKEKKGLLSKVKASIHGGGKDKKDSELQAEAQFSDSDQTLKLPEEGRKVVDTKTRRKSHGNKAVSRELLNEKEERIQHLEEVNRMLKQTNDELSEELGELRQKLAIVTAELEQTKSASKTLQDESRELIANLNMRGWLFKRGVRGLTASVWRRRYFRLDQGSKLYYYKNSSEGNPQGYIDIDKVISVQEVTASQQDKNHATFTIQCDGRTFQLQAHDEASMRKWIEAVSYMTNWRKKNSRAISDEI